MSCLFLYLTILVQSFQKLFTSQVNNHLGIFSVMKLEKFPHQIVTWLLPVRSFQWAVLRCNQPALSQSTLKTNQIIGSGYTTKMGILIFKTTKIVVDLFCQAGMFNFCKAGYLLLSDTTFKWCQKHLRSIEIFDIFLHQFLTPPEKQFGCIWLYTVQCSCNMVNFLQNPNNLVCEGLGPFPVSCSE